MAPVYDWYCTDYDDLKLPRITIIEDCCWKTIFHQSNTIICAYAIRAQELTGILTHMHTRRQTIGAAFLLQIFH